MEISKIEEIAEETISMRCLNVQAKSLNDSAVLSMKQLHDGATIRAVNYFKERLIQELKKLSVTSKVRKR
tara:strand:+ start:372 stop:581 length:210 start_codon:yes stop_codon:yes gene_type:complete